jgi:uncharacterized protein (TIGR01777 family)
MKVLVSGSRGFIGSALVRLLARQGHAIVRLVRSHPRPQAAEVRWNPQGGEIDPSGLENLDAVVHLAGENLVAHRWTARQKERIRDSRVKGTEVLCSALGRLSPPPRVMVCASAIGYYGDRGDEVLRETSEPGTGFLAQLCRQWEEASHAAAEKGIRVVQARTGMVLGPEGGPLAKMLLPFKLGLGGRLGSGRQFFSWIALEDAVRALLHALVAQSLEGAVNLVSPHPVTNAEFTRTLGRVLGRPTLLPLPGAVVRLALGEMASVALASARVQPSRLLDAGFKFRHAHLESALRHLLDSRAPSNHDFS